MSAQRSPAVPDFKPNQLPNRWEVELPLGSPKSEVSNPELDPPVPCGVPESRAASPQSRFVSSFQDIIENKGG